MSDTNDERIISAIQNWDKKAIRQLTHARILRPDMRLTNPRSGWRMPPIGHLIENIGYGANAPLAVLREAGWKPWAKYEIETDEGVRVRTTPVSHLIEFYVERRGRKADTVLFDALYFFMGLEDAPVGFNIPFLFAHVDEPIESKWSELSGQSLCAVMAQMLPQPIEFIGHVLGAGGRFHAGDPPGIFVLAAFQDELQYGEMRRNRADRIMDLLKDHRDHIEDEVVCAIEPITQRNLLHWMVAVCRWHNPIKSQRWITVLHDYGLKTSTRTGDGRTVMELAESNPYVRGSCLFDALRDMQAKESELYARIAATQQAMRGRGLAPDTVALIRPFGSAWRPREEATANWFDRRRATTSASWDLMSDWHPFWK